MVVCVNGVLWIILQMPFFNVEDRINSHYFLTRRKMQCTPLRVILAVIVYKGLPGNKMTEIKQVISQAERKR